MFKNQYKQIIRLAFFCLAISILVSVLIYRLFTIQTITNIIGKFHYISSVNYINDIWQSSFVNLKQLEINNLDQKIIDFTKNTLEYFNKQSVLMNIYDLDNKKILSNYDDILINYSQNNKNSFWSILDSFLLDKKDLNKIFLQVKKDNIRQSVLFDNLIIDKNNIEKKIIFIATYIPLKLDGKIVAILELLTDQTKQWNSLKKLTQEILLAFLGILALFAIIIIKTTSSAQKIIDQQIGDNLKLKKDNLQTENENKAQTEFLANISHELRTPLNAIIGFSEMIINENYARINTNQYKEYIQDINYSGRHLLSVINDILDFSKASIDQLKIESKLTNLNNLLKSTMRFIKPSADSDKINLILDLPIEEVIIEIDPKRLKQALLNLLSNAVKFTNNNGNIILSMKQYDNKYVEIKVIDNGIGMTCEDIPKALSNFGQVDNKWNRKYDGTGLGLPLTKKIIQIMGGEFKLESKLNVGTVVTLVFKLDKCKKL